MLSIVGQEYHVSSSPRPICVSDREESSGVAQHGVGFELEAILAPKRRFASLCFEHARRESSPLFPAHSHDPSVLVFRSASSTASILLLSRARERSRTAQHTDRSAASEMTRLTRSGTTRFVKKALLLLLIAATAQVSEAYYYGGWRGYGGRTVVRRTTVVRRGRGVWGRRLLQEDEKTEKSAKDGECRTILEIVESTPELSQLASALEDLPRLRAAMDQKNREDTFFAPTNDAIDSLLAWGGFMEKAKAGLSRARSHGILLRRGKPESARQSGTAGFPFRWRRQQESGTVRLSSYSTHRNCACSKKSVRDSDGRQQIL